MQNGELIPPSSWPSPPGEGGPRGHYGEPKLINPERAMESARNSEAENLTTDYTDERGSGTFQMRNGELIPPSSRRCAQPTEAVEATEPDEGDQVGRYRSINMIRSHPITSDQIRPNPTEKTVRPRSRRRPLDQNWRGRTSIWIEFVGCGEMLNG